MRNKSPDINELLKVMQRLRDPISGCPWDKKQTFQTIIPHTLEEAYEVIDTIERKDYHHLKEELGDLLFQVIFYSQIADEEALFNFDAVVSLLTQKLIYRHPHVFPDGTLSSRRSESIDPADEASVKKNWELLKKKERSIKGRHSALSDIPNNFPSLIRAQKLQKRAASQGFDWPSTEGVFSKINEEIKELKSAIAKADSRGIEEELGDIIFTVVNLCRHLDVDAETAARKSSYKFEKRFQYVEDHLANCNQEISETTPKILEDLWAKAKRKLARIK